MLLAAAVPFILSYFVVSSGRVDAESEVAGTLSTLRSESRHPMLLTAQPAKNRAVVPMAVHGKIGYDVSVVRALKKMQLNVGHFDAWLEAHEDSTLRYLPYMPPNKQKEVASIALFIRKSNGKIDEKTAWREAAAMVHYSDKYGIPSALTTAVAHAESTFNPDAVSSKGASGVMQVMWRIHQGLLQSNGIKRSPGKNPLADPEQAIAAGTLLLSRYIRAYGSVQTAMERYYGGKSRTYQRKIDRNIARVLTHHAESMN